MKIILILIISLFLIGCSSSFQYSPCIDRALELCNEVDNQCVLIRGWTVYGEPHVEAFRLVENELECLDSYNTIVKINPFQSMPGRIYWTYDEYKKMIDRRKRRSQ